MGGSTSGIVCRLGSRRLCAKHPEVEKLNDIKCPSSSVGMQEQFQVEFEVLLIQDTGRFPLYSKLVVV